MYFKLKKKKIGKGKRTKREREKNIISVNSIIRGGV
jgi:hypothetical protein